MSVKCPRCQVDNRDGAKRCMACNTDLSHVRPAGPDLSQTSRLCPAGRHPMDPSWDSCPYCRTDQEAAAPSSPPRSAPPPRSASPPPPPRSAPPPPPPRSVPPPPPRSAPPPPPVSPPPMSAPPERSRRKTAFGNALAAEAPVAAEAPAIVAPPAPVTPAPDAERPARRRTEFSSTAPAAEAVSAPAAPVPAPPVPAPPVPARAAPAAAPANGRRIVGMLITYSWRGDGQVFPVREGRNYLGSDPDNEITIDSDSQLSGRHATILYRGRNFMIDDEKSMNGTFVNGECVEDKTRLVNYAEIQTGSTVWTFISVEPQ